MCTLQWHRVIFKFMCVSYMICDMCVQVWTELNILWKSYRNSKTAENTQAILHVSGCSALILCLFDLGWHLGVSRSSCLIPTTRISTIFTCKLHKSVWCGTPWIIKAWCHNHTHCNGLRSKYCAPSTVWEDSYSYWGFLSPTLVKICLRQ